MLQETIFSFVLIFTWVEGENIDFLLLVCVASVISICRVTRASADALESEGLSQLGTLVEQAAGSSAKPVRTQGLRGPWRAVSRALHLPYAPKDVATNHSPAKVRSVE